MTPTPPAAAFMGLATIWSRVLDISPTAAMVDDIGIGRFIVESEGPLTIGAKNSEPGGSSGIARLVARKTVSDWLESLALIATNSVNRSRRRKISHWPLGRPGERVRRARRSPPIAAP